MLNGKVMIIHLTVALIEKILLYKTNYFPEPHTHSKNKIKIELGLPNCATKYDLKSSIGLDISDFAKKG